VLRLSAERSAGAHPYLTTPEHTSQARTLMGPQAFLAPEHKALLSTTVTQAREVGRKTLDMYLGQQNYVNNWKRLGFNDDDLTRPISDRLVDAMIAYGTADAIAARVDEHLDAGADHVPIRVLTSPDKLLAALTALAGPLGLSRSRG
jgi:probable F420-dependent oxidoreductase